MRTKKSESYSDELRKKYGRISFGAFLMAGGLPMIYRKPRLRSALGYRPRTFAI